MWRILILKSCEVIIMKVTLYLDFALTKTIIQIQILKLVMGGKTFKATVGHFGKYV